MNGCVLHAYSSCELLRKELKERNLLRLMLLLTCNNEITQLLRPSTSLRILGNKLRGGAEGDNAIELVPTIVSIFLCLPPLRSNPPSHEGNSISESFYINLLLLFYPSRLFLVIRMVPVHCEIWPTKFVEPPLKHKVYDKLVSH